MRPRGERESRPQSVVSWLVKRHAGGRHEIHRCDRRNRHPASLLTGAIPQSSVGGPIAIAAAVFLAALAVGIQEAWVNKRGALGWIVNLVVSLAGALLTAPLAGFVMMMLLSPSINGSSLAAAGGAPMAFALTGQMAMSLLGSWGALWVVNKWR